jgi:chaperone required for assembly of F1-ATPase
MRLPGGPLLALRSQPLAEAIAAEWQSAGTAKNGTWTLENVPLTRLAGTAQARIARNPTPTVEALAAYAQSDLLCYRAQNPAELVARQHTAWQPWLDWAAGRYGAVLTVTAGILHVPQPAHALAELAAALAQHDEYTLAGLSILVPSFGSLVLGLAVADEALPAETALKLAWLDELYQQEQWGEDAEAAARRTLIRADIDVAGRLICLARQKPSSPRPELGQAR